MSRVRTNIEIEDDYLKAIMDRFGIHTKTEAVGLRLASTESSECVSASRRSSGTTLLIRPSSSA